MSGFTRIEILGFVFGAVLFAIVTNFGVDVFWDKMNAGSILTAKPEASESQNSKTKQPVTATKPPVSSPKVAETVVVAAEAVASIDAGKKLAKKCAACHTFNEGGKNKVGPNLWAIVGREKASVEGYKYSPTFKNLSSAWTIKELGSFIMSPKTFAPGTKMSFKGISDDNKRKSLLLYLGSLGGAEVTVAEKEPQAAAAVPVEERSETPKQEESEPEATEPEIKEPEITEPEVARIEGAVSLSDTCGTCHNLEKGKGHKTGPNLWDIVGAKIGSKADYAYSAIFSAIEGTWGSEELDLYLASPGNFLPGTKSEFPGIIDISSRQKIIEELTALVGN